MEHIFCGIKFPAPRNYERIRVDVNFSASTAALKEKIKNEILISKNCEFSLVHCGNVLDDDEPISKYKNIQSGSTIHVLKKKGEDETMTKECGQKFTELDVSRVVSYFRALNSGNFHKISRPEVMKAIFSKHPELQKDIVALSFLKDPILLSNLQNPDTVRKMAEHHRILIDAAEDICKALKSIKTTAPTAVQQNFEQDFSDSSSSSSEGTSPRQASTSVAAGRRITSDLLRRSLAAAAGAPLNENSLANISQRNLNQASSSSSSSSRRNIISNSMFLNAMNDVMRSRSHRTEVEATEEQQQEPAATSAVRQDSVEEDEQMENDESRAAAQDERDVEMIASYQNQLRQMEDMGLTNKAACVQALMVCNGNLEAAVNLVLAEMNMS